MSSLLCDRCYDVFQYYLQHENDDAETFRKRTFLIHGLENPTEELGNIFHRTIREVENCARQKSCEFCVQAWYLVEHELDPCLSQVKIFPRSNTEIEFDFTGSRDGQRVGTIIFFKVLPPMVTAPQTYPSPGSQSEKSSSKMSIKLATEWLENCTNTHKKCGLRRKASYCPPTLLGIKSDQINLMHRDELGPSNIKYATLSYCWGPSPNFLKLASDNENKFKMGIPFGDLPLMMQEAILFIKDLGLDYIWIDCLCIRQSGDGSVEDWNLHTREMGNIYENCFINLAASIANTPNESLYSDKCAPPLKPIIIENQGEFRVALSTYFPSGFRDQSPLSKRAWAFQEATLSPRTLSIDGGEVFWECSSLYACKLFPKGHEVMGPGFTFDFTRESERKDKESENIYTKSLDRETKKWVLSIERYAQRTLTYPDSDKIVAMAGVAERFGKEGKRLKDDYFCGFFRQDIPNLLRWFIPGPSRHSYDVQKIGSSSYRAPSWSWAATDCPVRLPRALENTEVCQLLNMQITLKDPNNKFGPIISAKITLRCQLKPLPMTVQESCKLAGLGISNAKDFSTYVEDGNIFTRVFYDDDEGAQKEQYYPIYLLLLYHEENADNKASTSEGLIVKRLEDGFGHNSFIRVGAYMQWVDRIPETDKNRPRGNRSWIHQTDPQTIELF